MSTLPIEIWAIILQDMDLQHRTVCKTWSEIILTNPNSMQHGYADYIDFMKKVGRVDMRTIHAYCKLLHRKIRDIYRPIKNARNTVNYKQDILTVFIGNDYLRLNYKKRMGYNGLRCSEASATEIARIAMIIVRLRAYLVRISRMPIVCFSDQCDIILNEESVTVYAFGKTHVFTAEYQYIRHAYQSGDVRRDITYSSFGSYLQGMTQVKLHFMKGEIIFRVLSLLSLFSRCLFPELESYQV